MLKILICILFSLLIYIFGFRTAYAIEDSRTIPNNKMGVHILFVSELEKARELVNSNGGEWGYVTIPIQASDRDFEKWQKFMNDARKMKLIPKKSNAMASRSSRSLALIP